MQTNQTRRCSTDRIAEIFRVKPQTVRVGYCRDGHYMGLVPHKLPNRLLDWDEDRAEAIARGERVAA